MCGRYTLQIEAKSNAKLMGYFDNDVNKIPNNYNVAPTQTMPVVVKTDKGNQLELMHWGIPRLLSKDLVKELINTRSDKAFERFWGNTVKHRRCLIPASSFFEWKNTSDGKQPFLIHPKDQDIFAFAGIWSEWTDKNGHKFNAYSIMTTEPNKEMKAIHNRMPVILNEDEQEAWLGAGEERSTIEPLLRPYHDGGLEIYEVSKDVNSVRNNNEDVIKPIKSK